MSEPPAMPISSQTVSRIHSLQAPGRTREPVVEAQIARYLREPENIFWLHARSGDHLQQNWVQEETLVGLLRIREAERKHQEADRIMQLLLARSARKIARQVTVWHLPPQHIEDCLADIQLQLIEAIYSTSQAHEFWEVRFWLCLERRINAIARRYRTQSEALPTVEPIVDDEGEERSRLDQVADPGAIDPQQLIEHQEALGLLNESERCAFVLFHFEQWPQADIASLLGVTDRTIRNLLQRSQRKLRQWHDGANH